MKFFGYIFAVLFVLAAASSLVLFNINREAFDVENYKNLIKNENTYADSVHLAADFFYHSEMTPAGLKASPPEITEYLIKESFPPEMVQAFVEDALDQIFGYLNGKKDSISVVLHMDSLKATMGTQEFRDLFVTYLRTLPKCTDDQRNILLTTGFLEERELTFCNEPGIFTNDKGTINFSSSNGFMKDTLAEDIETDIPANLPIIVTGPGDSRIPDQVNLYRGYLNYLYIASATLLFLLTLFAVRSLRDGFNWWGYSILGSGIVTLILSGVLPNVASENISKLLDGQPEALSNTLLLISSNLLSVIFDPIKNQSIVLIAAGLICIAAAYWLSRKDSKKA